jgi:Toprim-like
LNQPPAGQQRSAPAADLRGFFAGLGVELLEAGSTNVSVRCFADREAHENDDRSPSTSVNLETGAWMCHACGAAGGPYHAARAVGLSEGEAQSLLAKHGLERRGGTNTSPLTTGEQELARYRAALLANEELLAQLTQIRGWSGQAIEELELGLEGSRIVFPIRDAHGLLVGVARYAPGPGRGDAPKMLADQGSKRELFPAPETVSEGEGFLFLVEGEPDAVAAHSLGLAAVALPGAAGWQREWRKRFAERKVVLVFDADEAGRKAARQVAGDLAPVAAEVRVLELEASRSDGYDLSDFLRTLREEQLTPQQQRGLLETRAARAPLVQPERGSEALTQLVSFLRRYVVLCPEQADAVALWVLHTHSFEAAEATPYLAITSAEKERARRACWRRSSCWWLSPG